MYFFQNIESTVFHACKIVPISTTYYKLSPTELFTKWTIRALGEGGGGNVRNVRHARNWSDNWWLFTNAVRPHSLPPTPRLVLKASKMSTHLADVYPNISPVTIQCSLTLKPTISEIRPARIKTTSELRPRQCYTIPYPSIKTMDRDTCRIIFGLDRGWSLLRGSTV